MESPSQITLLLQRFRTGDKQAADELLPLVYQELRKLAGARMKSERPDHTLQPTALVHEVYLRLVGGAEVNWQNRAHFMAVAATQMRRIILDHARADQSEKRGGGRAQVSLDEFSGASMPRSESFLALDVALERLAAVDERAARVVELRYFGGLTEVEVAEVLDVSVMTVRRKWGFARAWIAEQLSSVPPKEVQADT